MIKCSFSIPAKWREADICCSFDHLVSALEAPEKWPARAPSQALRLIEFYAGGFFVWDCSFFAHSIATHAHRIALNQRPT